MDWRFLPVFTEVDFATAYPGFYEPGMVATSLAIAILAAWVALSISSRIVAATTRRDRLAWAAAGAISMGGGIWAMHFIGMLAFSLPCGITYDPIGTVVSMIPGVLASGIALSTISQRTEPSLKQLTISAVFMGAGIGAMHYSGMAAMRPEALLLYSPGLVALSVVVAVGLAFVSLIIRFRLHGPFAGGMAASMIAATVMGCAVAGMHYTAMQAAAFFPIPNAAVETMALSPPLLAFLIAIFTILIAFSTLVATFAGRQNELAQTLTAEIAARKHIEQDLVRAREEAESASRAKSKFVATVSHEIRTPMNGVLGMARLLEGTALTEQQRRLVDNLSRSGKALLATINDILDFSKIEAGRLELYETEFDPRELIAEVTDLFSEPCATKGLEFVYFIAEEIPDRIRGDAVKLRQVLINLVGNAIKFTEHGEIVVEATCEFTETGEFTLNLSVADTGIGIPAEHVSRVFQSFYQTNQQATRARGGSGLGLAIAKNLVQIMGGEIAVESKVHVGSRFTFTVPVRRSGVAKYQGHQARAMPDKFRVLLVEANAQSRRILMTYLNCWRIDAVCHQSVGEAEAAWRAAILAGVPFHAAIVDFKGLGSSGLDLVRKLRAGPAESRPDVIALLGMGNQVSDGALTQLGVSAALSKPVRPSELFNSLSAIARGDRTADLAPFAARRLGHAHGAHFEARILLVEDNTINQEVAIGMLASLGCTPVVAANGEMALHAFATAPFDVVLMDCEMPVMDGFAAARAIREIEANRNAETGKEDRIVIIAVTAHALTAVHETCLAAGMNDFLVKPYSDAELIAMLRRWLPSAERTDAPPPQLAAAGESVLELDTIEQIRSLEQSGSVGLLSRVMADFAKVAPSLAEIIHTKCEAGDGDAVWRAAHGLRSSALALGARRLSDCCAEIEKVARESGTAAAQPLLARLDAELRSTSHSLAALV